MKKTEARNIGVAAGVPSHKCKDAKCPFHGSLTVRGRQLTGTIVSTKMRKTAVIEFDRLYFLPKYERYEKRRTKLKVHNPECISAKDGYKSLVQRKDSRKKWKQGKRQKWRSRPKKSQNQNQSQRVKSKCKR